MEKISGTQDIRRQRLTGERALFASRNLNLYDCIFDDGESPLKESHAVSAYRTMFKWKYPLWYCTDVTLKDCSFFEMARAGMWYTDRISMEDTLIEAPKEFRRCTDITLKNVQFTNAEETLWNCSKVRLRNVTARGDYFGMNCTDVEIDGFNLAGNYCFDGARNMTVRNAKLLSKDSFWNSENVTVYDSFISGEYLGWNSKNLTFINCTIESLQGLCYIDKLTMKDCRLLNTTLAFEYSSVDAEIDGGIDSVLNPRSGSIRAERIGTLTIEPDRVDPSKTKIVCMRADS